MIKLTPRQDEALFLKINMQYSHQEVANALGISRGAASQLVRKAKMKRAGEYNKSMIRKPKSNIRCQQG